MDREPEAEASKASFEELVVRNIETIARIEQAAHSNRTRSDVIADSIAGFCGRPTFVYVHLVWFGGWLLINTLSVVPPRLRFDKPPFSTLTLVVALEAIFLSAFILMSQNRQRRIADQRNHLDLQINLLAEQESSHLLTMMKQVMDHLGISPMTETAMLAEETDAQQIAEQIEQALPATPEVASESG